MSIYTKEQIEQLVQDNLGLVVSIAKQCGPPNQTELEEFIQLGRIGLWRAIERHDPQRGKLTTIAYWCILSEIKRYKTIQMKYYSRHENIGITEHAFEETNIDHIMPDNLTKKELKVLEMRLHGYTCADIASELNQTKASVSKIYKSAIGKIQNANHC